MNIPRQLLRMPHTLDIESIQYPARHRRAFYRQKQLDQQAEKAKLRFEARKERLSQEKIVREIKQKNAADARRATMAKKTASGENPQSAVAAAMARVKAKKLAAAATHSESSTSSVSNTNAGASLASSSDEKSDESSEKVSTIISSQANVQNGAADDKKVQTKDAIIRAKAKAKAKKLATKK